MNIVTICNIIIEYSFYALFFFVPLVFASDTSELFEFNKMWLTFGLAIIIAAAWGTKMVAKREFLIQRTPLDLPILLFLLSQSISTVFSLDMHTSLWGYYSRFNGGLLSLFSYCFLYYAFVSNFTTVIAKRALFVSLAAGAVVTLWGLPSHFGIDPTCYLFRGDFDASCWTESFQPKLRIFSTLGQPNWLATYLSILIPISIAFFFQKTQNTQKISDTRKSENLNVRKSEDLANRVFRVFRNPLGPLFLVLSSLFYVAILFTGSRSGFLGLFVGGFIFFVLSNQKMMILKFVVFPLLVLSLLIGTPIDQQLKQLTQRFIPSSPKYEIPNTKYEPLGPALETGGTESGKIRLIVWKGALDIWKHNPLFGSGAETFAFAYYKYRPIEHNLTSEWDYLYNKAHNEYLNYLATTGAFGLGTYLLMIGFFLTFVILKPKAEGSRFFPFASLKGQNDIMIVGLIAGYISILVSNFLGFSVVILNLYLFLIPAFVFVLGDLLNPKNVYSYGNTQIPNTKYEIRDTNVSQWIGIVCIILTSLFIILTLYRFWQADKKYALGQNLNRAGEYQHAYIPLLDAFDAWPNEPTFQDELSYNSAALAVLLANSPRFGEAGQPDMKNASESARLDEQARQAKIASYSAKLTKDALTLSNDVVSRHPNNIVFWKTRVRLLYLLSELDPEYLSLALDAIKHAQKLAPTDAKVSYSLAVLYGQNNDNKKAIETMHQTIKLKPDYKEAYYALGLFYHDTATDKNNKIIDVALQKKAIETMQYILDHFSSTDAQATRALKTWSQL